MTVLWAILPLLAPSDEDVFTVTLQFERLHCDECRAELETTLRKMAGVREVTLREDSVELHVEERCRVPDFARLPRQAGLKAITLTLRGTASFSGEKATFVARSGALHRLVNPEGSGADPVGDLRKRLGPKGRFQVTGTVGPDGKGIALKAFEPVDWKD